MTVERRRSSPFAQQRLQGTLLYYTAIYWFYCLFSMAVIAACWILFTDVPESSSDLFRQLWVNCGPSLLGSVLLLPLVLLDCLRLSNRFAAPMVRMQRAMSQLAAGEQPDRVELREGDFWREFADDFNCVADREAKQAEAPREKSSIPDAQPTEVEEDRDSEDKMLDALPQAMAASDSVSVGDIYSDLSL